MLTPKNEQSSDSAGRQRLTLKIIDQQAGHLPKVLIRSHSVSRWVPVDRVGLIVPGRQWPISGKPPADQIRAAVEWCEWAKVIKSPTFSSYCVKHTAERWAEFYISNGALIVAAGRVGIPMFSMPPVFFRSPNAGLAISRRWYAKHRSELWPERAKS